MSSPHNTASAGGGGGGGGKQFELPGPCYVKLGVSNVVAGSIIGKNGTNINQMSTQTGCTMRLSSTNCHFPGTTDRVMVISGEQDKIQEVVFMILELMTRVSASGSPNQQEGEAEASPEGQTAGSLTSPVSCRVIVPKSSVSAIIGSGGSQIKGLQDTTGARIQISQREEGFDERVVHIQGAVEAVKNAAMTICSSIQADQNLKNHMYVDYANHGYSQQGPLGHQAHAAQQMGGGGMGFQQFPGMGYPYSPHADILHSQCEVFLQVPDAAAGSVIGKSGTNLSQIADATGAKINVSQREEFFPGTQNRLVTMKGSVAQVHAAHVMLVQRLKASSGQVRQGGAAGIPSPQANQAPPHTHSPHLAHPSHSPHANHPASQPQAHSTSPHSQPPFAQQAQQGYYQQTGMATNPW